MRETADTPGVTLRGLDARDFAKAASLLTRTNADVSEAELEADFRRSFERWPSVQVGAYAGSALVGLVAGRIDRSDATLGWSDDIVLEEAHRAHGWGGKLLRAQLEAFRGLGCTRVRGLSPQSLIEQVRFFEHHGFRVIAEETAHGLWGVHEGERVLVTERLLD
jgi:GNAT superfamily N-acetyltransferase